MRKGLTHHARAPHSAARRPSLWILVAGLLACVPALAKAQSGQVGLPRFPSISPDGSTLIFSWRGDLWRASSEGGEAVRLTRHQLDDLHSSWSPDGEWIVFASMRDGYLNLWRMHRDGSQLTQLTYGDQHLRNPSFGRDENGEPVITFSGMLEADVYRDQRPYRLSPDGGEYTRLHDAFGSEPQLSPDGERVVFTRGGAYHDWNRRHYRGPDAMNVWLHELGTEHFEPLTERDGDDGMARWVDEDTLLFMSDREDQTVNLYRMELDAERSIERLTEFDRHDLQYFDVSRDGGTAVLQVWDTLLTLDLEAPDAEPEPIALRAPDDGRDTHALRRIDRDVSEAALSPDGQTMAYIAYGRVYVRHVDEQSPTRPVTPGTHARHHSLAWSPDGLRLYFVNDADGSESIYQAQVSLTRDEVRRSHERQRARSRVSAHHWDGDPNVSLASANPDVASEPPESPEADYDPDLAVRGEEPEDPFAPQDPGFILDPVVIPQPGDPTDVPPPTQEPQAEVESIPEEELEEEPPDALPAGRDPTRWHDAIQFDISPVVAEDSNDRDVSPSPDGRSLAFRRGRGDLVILDLESGEERTLVEGWDSFMHWRWSPDSRYIAYSQNDLDFSANVFVVPADGSQAPVNITRHPRNDLNPRWSADSRKLTFISNRSGENYDLYRVYLDREIETYTPRELSTYYRNAREEARGRAPLPVERDREPEATRDAVELDLEDAWRRIERITATPAHQTANEMTPGGDRYVFNAGSEGLVAMDWDGSDRTRIGPRANVQQLNITGEQVVYIVNGRVGVANLSGSGSPRYLDISDRLRIDLRRQALQKFHEAARVIGENFYRTDLKGLDWSAVVAEYASLIRRARTSSEFSDITNRLMGELAASHMGVSNPGPVSALREPSGRLGIESESIVSQQDGRLGYRVTEVIPDGPASRGPMPLAPGDIITEIGLRPFEENETLLQRLRGQVDQEVIVTFDRPGDDGYTEYRTMLRTIGLSELARLKYDAFREESRRRVDELSDGRLGYLHIQAMNQTSLEGFQGDLYAAAEGKDGLIIDVRNNGGGNTTDRILTSIMAGEHAYTIPAGADRDATGHYPQDRLDAPRYTLPINMLANEKSYSNAEILAHAFITLDRGTLVGQQTYGGVISTFSHTLIDGATVRRPFRGWYLPDGTDMEHNGAMPDLLVEQTPQDEVAGRDRQLERAVSDLLERIDATQ
ncbi:peptidase S41 [Halomonas sp. MCCC 1A17488]|uniref:S41 family peptidase n=1 Tax=unclassified Halomonas TaxID=2609666 RepID=UPI0018D25920|nr:MULTISPECIES: S41 family peptidase [unclassified Halomonas]MCE8017768.1 peptidase S41 [Halomonas sp. MCCC 1A17488]MCG3241101.1 peptidase S41 [Halomonas sp. MCCC 1A17488]QPP48958.1 PD40 domain-containing protein [Halomonas sp. SS10-MC5]